METTRCASVLGRARPHDSGKSLWLLIVYGTWTLKQELLTIATRAVDRRNTLPSAQSSAEFIEYSRFYEAFSE